MTVNSFLVFLVVTFIVYQLAVLYSTERRIRKYRQIRLKTLTQNSFGKARSDLMKLVAEGELDANSETFKKLYLINTKIMRNPDKYDVIAKYLREAILETPFTPAKKQTSALKIESDSWSPKVKRAVIANSDAMHSLMVYHSRLLQLVGSVIIGIKAILVSLKKFGVRYAYARWLVRRMNKRHGLVEKTTTGYAQLSHKENASVVNDARKLLRQLAV